MSSIPGFPDVLVTSYNPIPVSIDDTTYDGGVRWMSTGSGDLTKAYRIYNGNRTQGNVFGKANGIGDVVVLCDEAPLALGNRVWLDANGNGRQDPDESGLAGIAINLLDGAGTLLNSTTTAVDGTYYFTATNAAGTLRILPRTSYRIQVGLAQPALAGLSLSLVNYNSDAGNDAIQDVNDSDAIVNGAAAEVSFTTGGAGATNHGFDFGFAPAAPPLPLR